MNKDLIGLVLLFSLVFACTVLFLEVIKTLSMVLAQLTVYAGIGLLILIACWAFKSACSTHSRAKDQELRRKIAEYMFIAKLINKEQISDSLLTEIIKQKEEKHLTLNSPELNQKLEINQILYDDRWS